MSRSIEQITRELVSLRSNLRQEFGVHHDDELIAEVLQGKIRNAIRVQIQSATMNYDPVDAAEALDMLTQIRLEELERQDGFSVGQPKDYWEGQ